MNLFQHTFKPWTKHSLMKPQWFDNSRIVAPEEHWSEVERWNEDSGIGAATASALNSRGFESGYTRPRVLIDCELFEDWQGPVIDSRGHQLFVNDSWPDPSDWYCGGEDDGRALTMSDVRQRVFRLIDACPNLDFVLKTNCVVPRPRELKHYIPNPFDNLTILAHVTTQAEADTRIPELLKCSELCTVGVWAEPREEIDLRNIRTGAGSWLTWIKWLVCSGQPAPEKTQIDSDMVAAKRIPHTNSLRQQCQDAGVPFHFDELGIQETT